MPALTFPEFLHGGDYNPDQWFDEPGVIDEDFCLMRQAGCNTMSVGIFAWSRLEPVEGQYDFVWLDNIVARFHTEGIGLFLATPSGAKPFWLSEKYEETRRVDRAGKREHSGARHNHCWTSPVYREKVRAINGELARRYGAHPSLRLWHISNEYNGECFCPLCLEAFRRWLRERYANLETLNKAYWADFWSHRFSDWGQIDPRDITLDGLTLDWKRFVSWQTADFYRFEVGTIRPHSQAPATTNLMGFHDGVDYRALARDFDVVADDSYPNFDGDDPQLARHAAEVAMKFDLMRCLRGRPEHFFLMESCIDGRQIWGSLKLKPPGMHALEMLQAIAHGANGTMYFQWRKGRGGVEKYHGAVVGHAHAQESRSFREVGALGRRLAGLRAVLPSLNRADTALLLDWPSRWAYHTSLGVPGREDVYTLVRQAAAHHRPFWQRGAGVDVLGSTDDFSGYKVVLAPRLYLLLPGVAERLRDFALGGGTLVLTALTGMVNETNLCWSDGCPGDGLETLAGVWMDEVNCLKPGDRLGGRALAGNSLGLEGAFQVREVAGCLRVRDAHTLVEYADHWQAGLPALTVRPAGRGRVYFFAADFDAESTERIYDAIIREAGCRTFYPDARALPEGVSAVARHGDGQDFWFLSNFTPCPAALALPWPDARDAETSAPLSGRLELAPWEVRVAVRPEGDNPS